MKLSTRPNAIAQASGRPGETKMVTPIASIIHDSSASKKISSKINKRSYHVYHHCTKFLRSDHLQGHFRTMERGTALISAFSNALSQLSKVSFTIRPSLRVSYWKCARSKCLTKKAATTLTSLTRMPRPPRASSTSWFEAVNRRGDRKRLSGKHRQRMARRNKLMKAQWICSCG